MSRARRNDRSDSVNKKYSLKEALFPSPLDIVGDVHGEIGALQNLLSELGYSESGEHAEGRHLVFIGNLIDRGPDSPAVLRLVKTLVDNWRANCVLGNHELNLLCGILVGAYAMLGDLLSSFLKRRIRLPSSSRAPVLNQLPEALLPTVILAPYFGLATGDVIGHCRHFSLGGRYRITNALQCRYPSHMVLIKTNGFRGNFLPGLCIYKFLYVWMDQHSTQPSR